MTHHCPGLDCGRQVPADQLACRPHWYSLPKPIRTAVWRAWNDGAGAGSDAHTAAITKAIDYLSKKGHK